jgi:hypothetical protein
VLSKRALARTVYRSAYALRRVYGQKGDKNRKHQTIGAVSTVETLVELYPMSVNCSPNV